MGLIGIILSSVGITVLAKREYHIEKKPTLSELAARDGKTLRKFRIILWICVPLISIMMYSLVIPGLSNGLWLFLFYTLIASCEVFLALLPASGRTRWKHDVFAWGMALGMIVITPAFALMLTGVCALLESLIFGAMIMLSFLGIKYYERFIFFQLPYIFLSHMSILVAAIAVLRF